MARSRRSRPALQPSWRERLFPPEPGSEVRPASRPLEVSLDAPVLRLDVRGLPVPQGSARVVPLGGGRGARWRVTHDARGLAAWRRLIADRASAAVARHGWRVLPAQSPVLVILDFWIARPPSAPRRRRHPSVRPDLDKLARAALDALAGVAFADDAQVTTLVARKRYATSLRGAGLEAIVREDPE